MLFCLYICVYIYYLMDYEIFNNYLYNNQMLITNQIFVNLFSKSTGH
ncbi:protein of unknown function [Xenorhabdus bovienii]|uniref:Uncharacterized protein n=1 Tax=Xenorhabdus bovienii TaxID=40576 RepID=A0A0B6X8V5_XENBV|nr:protein of unknown function [Xenorhabdus bovienii]